MVFVVYWWSNSSWFVRGITITITPSDMSLLVKAVVLLLLLLLLIFTPSFSFFLSFVTCHWQTGTLALTRLTLGTESLRWDVCLYGSQSRFSQCVLYAAGMRRFPSLYLFPHTISFCHVFLALAHLISRQWLPPPPPLPLPFPLTGHVSTCCCLCRIVFA